MSGVLSPCLASGGRADFVFVNSAAFSPPPDEDFPDYPSRLKVLTAPFVSSYPSDALRLQIRNKLDSQFPVPGSD